MPVFEVNWRWNLTAIDDLPDDDITTLLKSRGYNIKDAKSQNLKNILITKYLVEDANLKSWDEMTVEQLRVELTLRRLNDKYGTGYGLKADLIKRLKEYHSLRSNIVKMPKIDNESFVYRYIQHHELQYELFIPHYLKDIIYAYTESSIMGFCLSSKEPNYIFAANINHKIPSFNKKYKAKVIALHNKPIESISDESAVTFANSMDVPSQIYKSITKHIQYRNNSFRVLFDVKDSSVTLNLIHNDEAKIKHRNMTAFQWTLPILTEDDGFLRHSVVYDDQYGLLVYDRNTLCSLSFNSKQCEFKKFSKLSPANRYYPSCVMIKTNDNKKQLFVCHGSAIATGHIYDFDKNEWVPITIGSKKVYSGICYNNMKQMIYTGGGMGYWSDSYNCVVESYDLMKDKWSDLPNTWLKYDRNPVMWNHNNNLLFIGSIDDDSLEYIDLRDRDRKWKIIIHPTLTKYGMKHDEMKDMFGLDWYDDRYNQAKLCVTRF